jgi:hypothetical protein
VEYFEKESKMQEGTKDWLQSDESYGQTYLPHHEKV